MQTADTTHQIAEQPPPPPDTPAQVTLTGTFREVNWITRTAQLYDDHGHMTPVSFTPDQDNWLRLVANIPVNLKGTYPDTPADASQNGRTDSNGAPQPPFLHLTEVKVTQRQWFPYDEDAFEEVRQDYVFDPETHKTLSFDLDVDDFMRSIRGPDYQGSAI